MIKFFRRIRQRLLSQNRFSKYLLYAVGEIILVVIGILIALQINNWNEEKKNTAAQAELISALILDLNEKMEENISDRQAGKRFVSRAENALTAVRAGNQVDTSQVRKLLHNIGTETWYFTTTTPTYNSIVNSDLWQRLPDSLAMQVQAIYDHRFSRVDLGFEKLTDLASDCRLNFLGPTGLMDPSKTTTELNEIIYDHRDEFISRLTLFIAGIYRQNEYFKDTSDAIEAIIPHLHAYRDELLDQID